MLRCDGEFCSSDSGCIVASTPAHRCSCVAGLTESIQVAGLLLLPDEPLNRRGQSPLDGKEEERKGDTGM